MCVVMTSAAFPQDCPQWGGDAAALKYLQENKANSTTLDPVCVNTAFATLGRNKSNAKALVGLLDFERSTEHDDFKSIGKKYPATAALLSIGSPAVPALIKAVKDNGSELIRTNAAHMIGAIHAPCVRGIAAKLEAESQKPETTPEQQKRLRAAKDYIENIYPPCKSESPTP